VKKNLLVIVAATLTLAACASAPKQAAVKQDVVKKEGKVIVAKQAQVAKVNSEGKVCEHSRATGSMLKNKRCRTKAQLEKEREEARDTMNAIHSSVTGFGEMHRQ
jgi:starvation-inducible outer membrane lipoprotein